MIGLALLLEAAQDVLPRTTEAWAFATLAFTTVAGGVGFMVKRWSDGRLDGAQREAKEATETAARLAATQDRLVESAERREKEATARTDAAIAGMALLTTSVTDLVASNRALASEVQRANTNVEYILRERK